LLPVGTLQCFLLAILSGINSSYWCHHPQADLIDDNTVVLVSTAASILCKNHKIFVASKKATASLWSSLQDHAFVWVTQTPREEEVECVHTNDYSGCVVLPLLASCHKIKDRGRETSVVAIATQRTYCCRLPSEEKAEQYFDGLGENSGSIGIGTWRQVPPRPEHNVCESCKSSSAGTWYSTLIIWDLDHSIVSTSWMNLALRPTLTGTS